MLTDSQRAKILSLASKGRLYTDISRALGLNHGSVRYFLLKNSGKNSNEPQVEQIIAEGNVATERGKNYA